ncbi:MAG: S1 RNA-binding domain-containing protein, partial [Coriobacteriales bacterium]
VGDKVEVQVLDVDLERERISLGLKQTQDDPWKQLVKDFVPGSIVSGRVTKIVPFGAFVEIGDGVEGLVHISEMAKGHVEKAEDVVSVGSEVQVKIMDVDTDRRRISLSLRAANEELGIEDAVPGPSDEDAEYEEDAEEASVEEAAADEADAAPEAEDAAEVETGEEPQVEDAAEAETDQ